MAELDADNRGNWPTMKDSPDGKTLPFSPDGYIDKSTGYYTLPERKKPEGDFTEQVIAMPDGSQSSMFVPRPKFKPCRIINFREPQAYLEVSEPLDVIRGVYDEACKDDGALWYSFTDPAYGTLLAVPRDTMRRMAWIVEAWKDIDAIKEQIKQAELARANMRVRGR